jgi:hypothetical protein
MRVIEISKNDWEKCETSGRVWEGNLVFIDDLKYENLDIITKGFQGFRYKWW